MNRILLVSCTLILGLLTFIVMNTVFAENTAVTIVRGASNEAALHANPPAEHQMVQSLGDFWAYLPSSTIQIRPNTTVTWYNNDTFPHTIKSGSPETNPGALFDSGIIKEGMRWNHTFKEVGEYGYFDSIYPQMTGTVIVAENVNITNTVRNNNSIQEHNNLSDLPRTLKG